MRGNCTFVQKFAAVSNQGASAMLVINDEHGGELRMAGYDENKRKENKKKKKKKKKRERCAMSSACGE